MSASAFPFSFIYILKMSLMWPGISKFFEQVKREDPNLNFKCLLCLPKSNFIRASVTSASNLRTHVKVRIFKIILYFVNVHAICGG